MHGVTMKFEVQFMLLLAIKFPPPCSLFLCFLFTYTPKLFYSSHTMRNHVSRRSKLDSNKIYNISKMFQKQVYFIQFKLCPSSLLTVTTDTLCFSSSPSDGIGCLPGTGFSPVGPLCIVARAPFWVFPIGTVVFSSGFSLLPTHCSSLGFPRYITTALIKWFSKSRFFSFRIKRDTLNSLERW